MENPDPAPKKSGSIAAGIALAIIPVMNGLGAKLNTKFAAINTSLK